MNTRDPDERLHDARMEMEEMKEHREADIMDEYIKRDAAMGALELLARTPGLAGDINDIRAAIEEHGQRVRKMLEGTK